MQLSKGEKVIHKLKPADRLIIVWLFSRCLPHGFVAGYVVTFLAFFAASMSGSYLASEFYFFVKMGVLLSLFFALVSFVYHRFLIESIEYFVTDRRCIWKGGILRKVEHSVSFGKITDVERSRNLIEQLLGIATLNLFTPGTASYGMRAGHRQPMAELRFEGLVKSVDAAETINHHVRSASAV